MRRPRPRGASVMRKAFFMAEPHSPNPYVGSLDRRSGRDRRQRGIPSVRDLLVYRRRRTLRRAEDRRRFALLDHYGASTGVAFTAVLVLSVTDAFLTLFLLSRGAVEVNPVMAYFININEHAFIWVKYGLTVLGVVIVLLLNYAFMQRFRLHVRRLLNCFVLIFALIVAWEIYLVIRITA